LAIFRLQSRNPRPGHQTPINEILLFLGRKINIWDPAAALPANRQKYAGFFETTGISTYFPPGFRAFHTHTWPE
tara:strand:+ start:1080 stop:1301 length:222 start_codon:yes stop_codon:yes gene_type:complete